VRECIAACGWDPDIVQLVVCYPEDAEALTKSPVIKHVTFIGSETVGRKVAQAALEHLTPVTLELGGKDPSIVLEGTNVKKWSSMWMRGVFQAMGQNCIGIERFIVHSSVYNEFVREMESRISKLRLGPSLVTSPVGEDPGAVVDGGSMINDTRFGSLEKIISAAVSEGARLVCGGRRRVHPLHEKASYFEPTLLTNVTNYMEIAQEEVFAPIMLVMKFETIEEAITLANGTKYGLGASVFGPFQRDCVKVAKQLECGMVSINDFGVFYLNQDLPFGGAKSSGYGRFAGPEGLRSLTNPKVIISDRFSGFIQTSIPSVVDYPIKSGVVGWRFVSGLIRFAYAYSWWDSIDGLIQLIRATR
jgi:acyl-CoA reductase-like NAD-dependent aldehyde dehydrogenase